MSCHSIGDNMILCTVTADSMRIQRSECEFCGQDSFHLVVFYGWYEPDAICLRCGTDYFDFRPTLSAKKENANRKRARRLYNQHKELMRNG